MIRCLYCSIRTNNENVLSLQHANAVKDRVEERILHTLIALSFRLLASWH